MDIPLKRIHLCDPTTHYNLPYWSPYCRPYCLPKQEIPTEPEPDTESIQNSATISTQDWVTEVTDLDPAGATLMSQTSEDVSRHNPLLSCDDLEGRGLSTEEREIWLQQYAKSVKADNAVTPVHLWNEWVWHLHPKPYQVVAYQNKFHHCLLDSLRAFLLR